MTTAPSDLLLPGYWVDPVSGAWCSLPWPVDPDEKMALVRSSLGPAIIDWSEGRTDEPGLIHYQTGEPWRWTVGQRRFLVLWYHVDRDGRFTYRTGVKRGAKGTGKDPMAAAMCNTELCGPVELFDFDDRTGRPLGRPRGFPLVQVISNSGEQSKDVLRVANGMWSRSAREFYDLDCGETRTVMRSTGGRFEVPPTAEGSGEGDPSTFIALNEALALDTPIPTPAGWTTMGALAVGDQVLSPQGYPVTVTKATEVYDDRCCYRVTFSDGDSIVADAGHLWAAQRMDWPATGRNKVPQVRTTQDMAESGHRYKIPVTEPMKLPDVDLPVDPYVLGAWLGDGSRGSLAITTSAADMDWWLQEFPRLGVPARHRRSTRTGEEITLAGQPHTWDSRGGGLRSVLVNLGLYDDKYIPAEYLRASFDQRLALLQGLIDTDGCVDSAGRVIFVNTNPLLAEGVAELAQSMGHVVHVSCRADPRKESYLPVWRVEWQGDATVPSARMPRKRDRLRVPTQRMRASRWNRIVSIEPVESVPVRCIAVDSPDHLFLAGKWKATHNTHHMTESSGGARVARMAYRNVGKSPAQIQARVCEFTNAHRPGQESVAEKAFLSWQRQQAHRYRGKRDILYDSIEAPPDTDILSEDGRERGLRAAYMDAEWNDIPRISAEMCDERTPVADTIRYYLNGLAVAEDAWVDPRKFDALARVDVVVADREQIVMFLDCSKSEDATGLVGCRLSDGYTFVLGLWQRPHGERGKDWLAPRNEVDARVREAMNRWRVMWFGVDPSPARDDENEALYWAAMIDGWHRDFGKKLPLWATPGSVIGHAVKFDMRLSQRGGVERNKQFTEMAELVAEWIDEERSDGAVPPLTHDGDPGLRMHVHNAKRRPNEWGVSLSKETRSSSKLIDLAVCMVGAHLGRRIALNSNKIRPGNSIRKVVVLS